MNKERPHAEDLKTFKRTVNRQKAIRFIIKQTKPVRQKQFAYAIYGTIEGALNDTVRAVTWQTVNDLERVGLIDKVAKNRYMKNAQTITEVMIVPKPFKPNAFRNKGRRKVKVSN